MTIKQLIKTTDPFLLAGNALLGQTDDPLAMAVGRTVKAKSRIRQHPNSDDPDVPRAAIGEVVDQADGYLIVDFGEIYGSVLCELDELVLV